MGDPIEQALSAVLFSHPWILQDWSHHPRLSCDVFLQVAPNHQVTMHFKPDVSPDAPIDEQPAIGLIGMGAMGKMYAKYLSEAGWKK